MEGFEDKSASPMQQLWDSGHLSGANAEYVEALYESYLEDPASVPDQWSVFFAELPGGSANGKGDVSHARIQQDFKTLGKRSRYTPLLSNDAIVNSEHESKQVQVMQLISSYRVRGHQKAALDPLGLMHRERVADLELEFHGLGPLDSSTVFQTGSLFISKDKAPLAR